MRSSSRQDAHRTFGRYVNDPKRWTGLSSSERVALTLGSGFSQGTWDAEMGYSPQAVEQVPTSIHLGASGSFQSGLIFGIDWSGSVELAANFHSGEVGLMISLPLPKFGLDAGVRTSVSASTTTTIYDNSSALANEAGFSFVESASARGLTVQHSTAMSENGSTFIDPVFGAPVQGWSWGRDRWSTDQYTRSAGQVTGGMNYSVLVFAVRLK
jgi:hypothetical protein